MSGDYSRFSYDARRRFVAVLSQQGRVQLDSDWNEQADLLRERTRLLSLDTGGAVWLPWDVTPNAFLVGPPGGAPADVTLGEGRIYVDGRLAEIFPGEGVTYLKQPFLPDPPPYAPTADSIVYLDLWEREISWAEDPRLLDVALGGVDTTTRLQQVWQVKLATPDGDAVCGIDLDAMFPPSAGRLTTSAVAPPAPDDPCILPPNAGYRGIENRLYRVEVQVPGPLGTALFKWSRDNGSIVSRVSAISVAGGQSRITVNRIGRDQTLRFRIGDWVTLTDDHRDLHGEAGQMARIVDIDEANRVVTLDRAVPTAGRAFGATAADIADRNTRLQRWDEQAPRNPIDADGLMTTAAGPIELEDGVLVSFSVDPAGGSFHIGDYWVFAARTADASVEELNGAAPRGIRHHYVQLAAIPAGGLPTDCRPPPPVVGEAKSCCTFVVAPGEDIQKAIDALPKEGGCVCLKAGLHLIDAPLLIRRNDVTLHGESQGAIVFGRRGATLLAIMGANDVRVHDIEFRQGEAPSGQPAIFIERAQDLVIADCRIETMATRGAIGINIVASEQLRLEGLQIAGPMLGIWINEASRDVTVSDGQFDMPGSETAEGYSIAVLAMQTAGFVTVERCRIEGANSGIVINDDPAGLPQSRTALSRVSANRIALVRAETDQRAYGIDMAPPGAIVTDNHILHEGGNVTGIRMGGNGSGVRGNLIRSLEKEIGSALAIGIGEEIEGKFLPLERIIVSGNIIEGVQHGIIARHVARAEIVGNQIGRAEDRIGFGIILVTSNDCLVGDNAVSGATTAIGCNGGARNSISSNQIAMGQIGIVIGSEEAPAVRGNRLTGPATAGLIAASLTGRCDIVENQLANAASDPAGVGVALGIVVALGTCRIAGNDVLDTGLSADGATVAPVARGIFALYVQQAQVDGNRVDYSDRGKRDSDAEDRALLMQGLHDWQPVLDDKFLALGSPVQIAGNSFAGGGRTALVELRESSQQVGDRKLFLRFERVLFSGNDCWHVAPSNFDRAAFATVSLVGRTFSIATNQVRATARGYASYHLHDRPGPFMGNVSSGPVLGRSGANDLPAPQPSFNMTV